MDALSTSPATLLSSRLLLLRELVQSLETSRGALTQNNAEMIALGAARQAALCRQWSQLEEQLQHARRMHQPHSSDSSDQIADEFSVLTSRIRHLTRVHCSLLRHLQRSLTIVGHVASHSAITYAPALKATHFDVRPQAGA
jgi:hypothetical protein